MVLFLKDDKYANSISCTCTICKTPSPSGLSTLVYLYRIQNEDTKITLIKTTSCDSIVNTYQLFINEDGHYKERIKFIALPERDST